MLKSCMRNFFGFAWLRHFSRLMENPKVDSDTHNQILWLYKRQ